MMILPGGTNDGSSPEPDIPAKDPPSIEPKDAREVETKPASATEVETKPAREVETKPVISLEQSRGDLQSENGASSEKVNKRVVILADPEPSVLEHQDQDLRSGSENQGTESDWGEEIAALASSPDIVSRRKGTPAVIKKGEDESEEWDTDSDTTESGVVTTESGEVTTGPGVVTTESGEVTTKSGVLTTDSGIVTTESGVVTKESGVVTTESGVVTTESGVVTTESGVVTTESGEVTTESGVVTTESGVLTTESGVVTTESGEVTTVTGVDSTHATIGTGTTSPPFEYRHNDHDDLSPFTSPHHDVEDHDEQLGSGQSKTTNAVEYVVKYQADKNASEVVPIHQAQSQETVPRKQSIVLEGSKGADISTATAGVTRPKESDVHVDSLPGVKNSEAAKPQADLHQSGSCSVDVKIGDSMEAKPVPLKYQATTASSQNQDAVPLPLHKEIKNRERDQDNSAPVIPTYENIRLTPPPNTKQEVSKTQWIPWSPQDCTCCGGNQTPSTVYSRMTSPCCNCHTCCSGECGKCYCCCHSDDSDHEDPCLPCFRGIFNMIPRPRTSSQSVSPGIRPERNKSVCSVGTQVDETLESPGRSMKLNVEICVEPTDADVEVMSVEAVNSPPQPAGNIVVITTVKQANVRSLNKTPDTNLQKSPDNLHSIVNKSSDDTLQKFPDNLYADLYSTVNKNPVSDKSSDKPSIDSKVRFTPGVTEIGNTKAPLPEKSTEERVERAKEKVERVEDKLGGVEEKVKKTGEKLEDTKSDMDTLQLRPAVTEVGEEEKNEIFSFSAMMSKLSFYKQMIITPKQEESNQIVTPTENIIVDKKPSPQTEPPVLKSPTAVTDPDIFERPSDPSLTSDPDPLSASTLTVDSNGINKKPSKGVKKKVKRFFNVKKTTKKMKSRYRKYAEEYYPQYRLD